MRTYVAVAGNISCVRAGVIKTMAMEKAIDKSTIALSLVAVSLIELRMKMDAAGSAQAVTTVMNFVTARIVSSE